MTGGHADRRRDAGDAHVLAEIVRLDRDHHRPIAGDSAPGEAMKLVARSHQSMIWDRTRHVLRLRSALREYFPSASTAFLDLDAPDALAVLAAAPDPDRAAKLSIGRISAALRKAGRRDMPAKAREIQANLRDFVAAVDQQPQCDCEVIGHERAQSAAAQPGHGDAVPVDRVRLAAELPRLHHRGNASR
jgi:hypothetical protein